MRILGIDPGLQTSGFAIVGQEHHKTSLISCGFLPLSSKKSVGERVSQFYDFFKTTIIEQNISILALEQPFLGKNVQSFLKLGYLRGLMHLLSAQHNIELFEFFPREVKMAVTGFGGAQKDQVARVIAQLYPRLPAMKKSDVTDAIAIALCCAWKYKNYTITKSATIFMQQK
jgi:crossover junction endodeoxyribonuclease RuvC